MRVLFDTNVLIDAAVPEREFHGTALELLAFIDRGAIRGLVAPSSIMTCWYVATFTYEVDPRPLFEEVETLFEFVFLKRVALRQALSAPTEPDFEDEYLAAGGEEAGAELVVTRNVDHFAKGRLPPQHPSELVDALRQ